VAEEGDVDAATFMTYYAKAPAKYAGYTYWQSQSILYGFTPHNPKIQLASVVEFDCPQERQKRSNYATMVAGRLPPEPSSIGRGRGTLKEDRGVGRSIGTCLHACEKKQTGPQREDGLLST
jgi:hypothetical protein